MSNRLGALAKGFAKGLAKATRTKSKGQGAGFDESSETAISIRSVSFSYTRKPFIEDFNLDIPRGKVTSIVGPNGSGKSTLLKLVDGLVVPHKGEILIEGTACLSMSGKERARRLALLVQGPRPPAMSVETLVACGRYPSQGRGHRSLDQSDRQHIENAMTLAKVAQFRHKDMRKLSGGEQQRAFMAMTLAQDTGIIVFDEPTNFLDVRASHEIMQLVRELNGTSGKTFVMVIHDLDLALRYSDNVVVMEQGRSVFVGGVDEAYESKVIESTFHVKVCRFPSSDQPAYTLFPLA